MPFISEDQTYLNFPNFKINVRIFSSFIRSFISGPELSEFSIPNCIFSIYIFVFKDQSP